MTFIAVSLVRIDRFFISKFHYAKSDFKYSDQFLSDQRAALFLKIIKIIKLCFFGSDRELKHTLRYHLNATKMGAEAMGTKESENTQDKERPAGSQSLFRGLMLIEILSNYPNGCPLAHLSELAGLNKSTVHRLLQGLQSCGYVTPAPAAGSYRLTTK
ncbi:MAG: IclR family transcriptional regulator, partial [Klebsiella grimontii]|nr:IclR family transcriptional regulator [Klebsiella grimontii]